MRESNEASQWPHNVQILIAKGTPIKTDLLQSQTLGIFQHPSDVFFFTFILYSKSGSRNSHPAVQLSKVTSPCKPSQSRIVKTLEFLARLSQCRPLLTHHCSSQDSVHQLNPPSGIIKVIYQQQAGPGAGKDHKF